MKIQSRKPNIVETVLAMIAEHDISREDAKTISRIMESRLMRDDEPNPAPGYYVFAKDMVEQAMRAREIMEQSPFTTTGPFFNPNVVGECGPEMFIPLKVDDSGKLHVAPKLSLADMERQRELYNEITAKQIQSATWKEYEGVDLRVPSLTFTAAGGTVLLQLGEVAIAKAAKEHYEVTGEFPPAVKRK